MGLRSLYGSYGHKQGYRGAYMHMDTCFLLAGEVSLIQGSPWEPLEGVLGFRDI